MDRSKSREIAQMILNFGKTVGLVPEDVELPVIVESQKENKMYDEIEDPFQEDWQTEVTAEQLPMNTTNSDQPDERQYTSKMFKTPGAYKTLHTGMLAEDHERFDNEALKKIYPNVRVSAVLRRILNRVSDGVIEQAYIDENESIKLLHAEKVRQMKEATKAKAERLSKEREEKEAREKEEEERQKLLTVEGLRAELLREKSVNARNSAVISWMIKEFNIKEGDIKL